MLVYKKEIGNKHWAIMMWSDDYFYAYGCFKFMIKDIDDIIIRLRTIGRKYKRFTTARKKLESFLSST
jgi:hypothetical protein